MARKKYRWKFTYWTGHPTTKRERRAEIIDRNIGCPEAVVLKFKRRERTDFRRRKSSLSQLSCFVLPWYYVGVLYTVCMSYGSFSSSLKALPPPPATQFLLHMCSLSGASRRYFVFFLFSSFDDPVLSTTLLLRLPRKWPLLGLHLCLTGVFVAPRHRFFRSLERYKYDNIIAQDLDLPERTTQEYEGPGMVGFSRHFSPLNPPLSCPECASCKLFFVRTCAVCHDSIITSVDSTFRDDGLFCCLCWCPGPSLSTNADGRAQPLSCSS